MSEQFAFWLIDWVTVAAGNLGRRGCNGAAIRVMDKAGSRSPLLWIAMAREILSGRRRPVYHLSFGDTYREEAERLIARHHCAC